MKSLGIVRHCFWTAPLVLFVGCSTSAPPPVASAIPPANVPPARTSTSREPVVAAISPFASDDQTPANPEPVAPPDVPVDAAAAPPPMEGRPSPLASPAVAAPLAGAPAPVVPAGVEIPAGTTLRVRIDDALSTRRNRAGDRFDATLLQPVTMGGRTVLPAGTRFHGHLTAAKASGRLKGRAYLALTLDGFQLQGRTYRVATSRVDRVSAAHKKRNAVLVGGGAVLGATIGALAGGGKGAAIGAGAGGGAGLAGAAATGKRQVGVSAESALTFVLEAPVRV